MSSFKGAESASHYVAQAIVSRIRDQITRKGPSFEDLPKKDSWTTVELMGVLSDVEWEIVQLAEEELKGDF